MYDFYPHPSTYTDRLPERKQSHSPSTPIPPQETRWFPLGLLSPRLHDLPLRHHGNPNAKRSRSAGTSPSNPTKPTRLTTPKAPVHTDSLTIYKTTLSLIPTSEGEGSELRRPITKATAVVEQRVSHFLMGLAIIGTMTGPLLIVLHTMPAAVFAGVFFIVGWGSIEGNGILAKLVFLLRENRFVQRDEPLLRVPRRKIALYVACQVTGVAACVAISQTVAAIGFPVLITAMIPFRVWIVPRWFAQEELDVLDDLTANNKVVLASLGGPPRFPGEKVESRGQARDGEEEQEEHYGVERRYSEQRRGSMRYR